MDLFREDAFELVTGKRTCDKDDEKDKYLNEKTGRTEISEVKTHTSGDKILRGKHEDDPQEEACNYPIFQEVVIIFLSLVEKAKGNTEDQIHQFKPHTNALSKASIAPLSKKVSGTVLAGPAGTLFGMAVYFGFPKVTTSV
jgi:hypothetical protein